MENKITTEETVDLCLKNPKKIEVANCIKARVDAGISNLQSDGSGVIEPSEKKLTVLLSNQGTKIEKETDIATCLMARDYKGFGN